MFTPAVQTKTIFVVVYENTLCYIHPLEPYSANILRASCARGASRFEGAYFLVPLDKRARPATRKDFADFGMPLDGSENCRYHDFPKE